MSAQASRKLRLEDLAERTFVRSKRSRTVSEAIIQEIVERGWPEGETLGTELELLARLGVSRATFREAVRDLERHGVITAQRGRGLVVAAPARATIIASLVGFLCLDGATRQDAAEVDALLRPRRNTEVCINPVTGLLLDALSAFADLRASALSPALFPVAEGGDKLAAATAQRIAADIADRRANDRLGTEADYLVRYAVSRATLREALSLVEGHGLIVRRRGIGGGLFKGRAKPGVVAEAAAIFLHYLHVPAATVLEARVMLEPEMAARVARLRASESRAFPASTLDRWTKGLTDTYDRHRTFHLVLAELSGNPVLSLFVQLLMQSYYLVETSEHPDFIEGLERTHRAIAYAVARGDDEAARTAMIEHLEFAGRWTNAGLLRI